MAPARNSLPPHSYPPPPPSEYSLVTEASNIESINGGKRFIASSHDTNFTKEDLAANIGEILDRFKARGKSGATLDETTEALVSLCEHFALCGLHVGRNETYKTHAPRPSPEFSVSEWANADNMVPSGDRFETEPHLCRSSRGGLSATQSSVTGTGTKKSDRDVTTSSALSIFKDTVPGPDIDASTNNSIPKDSCAPVAYSWIDVLDFAFVQSFRPSAEAIKGGGQKTYNEFRQFVKDKLASEGTVLNAETKSQIISEAYKAWKDCQDDGPGAVAQWGSGKQRNKEQQVRSSRSFSHPGSLVTSSPEIDVVYPDLKGPAIQGPIPFRDPFSTTGETTKAHIAAARRGPKAGINIKHSAPYRLSSPHAATVDTTPGSEGEILTWPKFQARKRIELKRMNPDLSKTQVSSATSRAWEQYKVDHEL